IDSGTPPCFSAGGPIRAPKTADTISSRSRLLTSSRRSSGRPLGIPDAAPVVRLIVGIERLLLRPEPDRHMLQVDAHARPRAKPPAHRVDEDVGRLEMRACVRMARLPALEPGERGRFFPRAADFDERMLPPSLRELRRRRGWGAAAR